MSASDDSSTADAASSVTPTPASDDEAGRAPPEFVLALDLGTNTLVAAVAQLGVASEYPILVRNSTSELSTDAVICYAEEERLVGSTAASHLVSQPDDTIEAAKAQLDAESAPAPAVSYRVVEEQGLRGVAPRYRGGEAVFVPFEQVLAAFVRRMQQHCLHDSLLWQEHAAPASIDRLVVSVPNGSSERLRQAVVDACSIAGARLVDLVDDGVAAALCYGTSRRVAPGSVDTALFCDMGAAWTNLTLAAVSHDDVRVLRSVSARLGGRDFDHALFDHYAAECAAKYRIDVAGSKKASAKLLRAIQQCKTVLATGTATAIELESLLDDTDVTLPFNRAIFTQVCAPLLERFQALVRSALPDDTDKIKVELLGSALILPILQESLMQAAGVTELHRHLDQATSVAIGAGIVAALGGLRVDDQGRIQLPPSRSSSDDTASDAPAASGAADAPPPPPLRAFVGRLDADALAKYRDAELAFERNDEQVQQLSNLRNAYEQWIYRTREQLREASAGEPAVQAQRDEAAAALAEAEEWLLYGDEATSLGYDELSAAVEARKAAFAAAFAAFAGWLAAKEEEKRRQELEYAEAMKNAAPRARRDKLANPRTNKERLKAAAQRKEQGNTAFANVDYKTALMRYTQAIEVLVDLSGEVTPEQRDEADKLLLLCNLNSAACSLKFKGDSALHKAVATARRALELNGPDHRFGQPNSVKALHRKASAHIALKQYDEAKQDLLAATKLDSANKALQDSLANVEKTLARLEKERQQMFQRMFE